MDHTPELPQSLRKQESPYHEVEFGPQIPPNLMKNSSTLPKTQVPELESNEMYGPICPLHLKMKNPAIENDDDDSLYGPSLPPHLLKKSTGDGECKSATSTSLNKGKSASSSATHFRVDERNDDSNFTESDVYGPLLPPHLRISTNLQTSRKIESTKKDNDTDLKSDSNVEKIYGPVLPSHVKISPSTFNEDEEEDSYCPDIPPHLKIKQSSNSCQKSNGKIEKRSTIEIPNDRESSEDDDVYGPMPPTQEVDMDEYIESTLHQRTKANQKRLQDGKNKAPKREDWMLTLPEDRPLFSGLGLQARQFSKSGKRDRGDTSVWTDTPADKERKAKKAAEGRRPEKSSTAEEVQINSRDERLQAAVDRHNEAKRPRPLIDTHQSSQKKAKKEKDGLSVTGVGADRKPFSREDDLHVNKFDEAQKSSILKKARDLNDRFSSGKSSKFL